MSTTCRRFVFLFAAALVAAAAHQHHRVPIIDLKGADGLIGTVREDQRVISVVPELALLADTGPVCSYEINSATDTTTVVVPLIVDVTDRETGSAVLRVKDGVRLDCSVPEYALTLVAVRCDDDAKSESVSLKIIVKDTNDHAPEFDQPWYTVEIDEGKYRRYYEIWIQIQNEGRLYAEMLRLSAIDRDCGHPYGQICRYEISNALDADLPFAISDQGILRNIRPLNYSSSHSHILSIVAHDCGMRKSKSTLVTVNVRRACVAGIRNAPERIDYYPTSGAKYLFPDAQLNVCEAERDCVVRRIKSVVHLRTEHIGRGGCDRNVFASNEDRQRCGINSKTVDLLPRPELATSTESTSDTSSSSETTLDNNYFFDGTDNAVIVPTETIQTLIPTTFTLSFSMRHAKGSTAEQNEKHSIVCESDDHQMNRHHFAVYVHHCKLAMLMRHEYESDSDAKFRPAEWRWQLAQTCDDRWHHYAIIFTSLDKVELYVDGKAWPATDPIAEILDDWPLHKTKDNKTRFVVGACWHGRAQKMAQFFKGHLAEMLYLPAQVERVGALQCLHQCQEQLQFNGLEKIVSGESIVFNHYQSTVTLTASKPDDLSKLLQKVVYINLRDTPTPGHRGYDITTALECEEGNEAPLPTVKGYIFVQKASRPTLRIGGTPIVINDQNQVKNGAPMLPDIKISVTQPGADGIEVETTAQHKLDWCKIHLRPDRDMDLEYFSSPAALIASLHLDFEHDKQGVLLKGIEKVKGYREVLSKIHYFNTHPDSYAKRFYMVQCSMLNGAVLSNEFNVTMSIEKKATTTTAAASVASFADDDASSSSSSEEIKKMNVVLLDEHHHNEVPSSDRLQNILEMDLPRPKALTSHHNGIDAGQGAIASSAVAVIVVVCVGFLLVLLVIGVLRMRETPMPRRRRRGGSRKTSTLSGTGGGAGAVETNMEWDDSGMNIIVNPLDDVDAKGSEVVIDAGNYSDEESCSDSYREDDMTDDDEEDDEVDEVLPHVASSDQQATTGLEWDDSTLTNNVSRTYRV